MMEGEGETTSTSWLSRAWRGTRDGESLTYRNSVRGCRVRSDICLSDRYHRTQRPGMQQRRSLELLPRVCVESVVL